jgi:hypothetical protein
MDLRQKLSIIASIEAGYTINARDCSLIYHKSIYTATIRSIEGENRHLTLNAIENIINQGINALPSEISYLHLLKGCRLGLQNLKKTYNDDEKIKKRIDDCFFRLDNACLRFEKWIIASIEQIPDIIATMQATNTDVTSLCLVRQTPIMSPNETPFFTPNKTPSKTPFFTPNKTPSKTPFRSPNKTPPPTPPSSPLSHQIEKATKRMEPKTPPSTPSKIQKTNVRILTGAWTCFNQVPIKIPAYNKENAIKETAITEIVQLGNSIIDLD